MKALFPKSTLKVVFRIKSEIGSYSSSAFEIILLDFVSFVISLAARYQFGVGNAPATDKGNEPSSFLYGLVGHVSIALLNKPPGTALFIFDA
ncbi:hypothetical protein D3C85_1011030 [compost metagenome]